MLSKDKIKKQARLLVRALAAQTGPLQYQDALEVLAQLNGHKDWKTMSALLERTPVPVECESEVPNGFPVIETNHQRFAQSEVPGEGFLYRVPVCVDTSMSCVVLVRAKDRDEAIDRARTLVSEGKAPLEVDEGIYRGRADYYCPDSSDDAVFRVAEPSAVQVVETAFGCQAGPFLVELTDLGDGDDSLLCADLTVFDPEQEEGEPISAMSCLDVDASEQERRAFCSEVASTLAALVSDVSKVDNRTFVHAFVHLVQAGLTPEAKRHVAGLFKQ